MSWVISLVLFRNSRVARSTSLDWVMYRPTMMMSAPFAKASGAVCGVIPPATATKNFLPLKVSRISLIMSQRDLPVASASIARCKIATSHSNLT